MLITRKNLLAGASALATLTAHAAHAQTAAPAPSDTVGEIVITGSRLQAAGFTAPTPVTVVGAAQIEQRGSASVFEFVRDIPTFRASSGPSVNSTGAQNASKANLDLRGLGSVRTLILVNGRRHVPDSQTNVFDTNLLPTSLIDRVDIVTGGASAAYGSDAVAGVVNFVLKNHLEGFTGTAQYGLSQRGDNAETNLSVAGGFAFAGGKGHFIAGADFTHNNGTGTMYARKWGQLEPGALSLPANRAAGLPAQIIANGIETSAYTANGLIPSGPLRGTAFGPNGEVYQMQYGAILGNTEMIGTGNYGSVENPDQRLRPAYERAAALARAEYEISDTTVLFAQAAFGSLFTEGKSFGARIPNFSNYPVLRTNPFLPASVVAAMVANNLTQIPYSASRHDDLGSIASHNRTNSFQYDAGVSGKVFGDWKWDIGAGFGHAVFVPKLANTPRTADFYASAYVVAGPNGQPVCGPVATNPYFNAQTATEKAKWLANVSPNCQPYNIFGNNLAQNAAAFRYFNSASQQHNVFEQTTLNGNLAGEPFSLPAGPVSLAVGFELRKDTAEVIGCPDCQRGALMNQNYPTYNGKISDKEAYAEAGVPLLRDVTLFKSLDLNGAIRRTDYSTSGAVTTWKVGATWEPVEMLRFRFTRSRDIRAPNINELFNPGSEGNPNIVNRITGVSGFIKSNTVGNPNLRPEIGDTNTAGVVFQPTWSWAQGFRASLDVYDIKIRDVISTLGVQDVLDGLLVQRNASFAKYVERDPSNPVGVSRVNSPQQNLNALKTNGLDIEVAYRVPIEQLGAPGRFNIRALGTYVAHLRTITPTTNIDSAGSSMPRWSWNVLFTYNVGKFTTNVQTRYTSHIKFSPTLIGPDDPAYSPTLSNSINRNIWPEALYWNLNLQYDIVAKAGKRLQVFGVVDNLFDKDPPIVAISINGSPYDLVGRSFKAGVRFTY